MLSKFVFVLYLSTREASLVLWIMIHWFTIYQDRKKICRPLSVFCRHDKRPPKVSANIKWSWKWCWSIHVVTWHSPQWQHLYIAQAPNQTDIVKVASPTKVKLWINDKSSVCFFYTYLQLQMTLLDYSVLSDSFVKVYIGWHCTYQQLSFLTADKSEDFVRAIIMSSVSFVILQSQFKRLLFCCWKNSAIMGCTTSI